MLSETAEPQKIIVDNISLLEKYMIKWFKNRSLPTKLVILAVVLWIGQVWVEKLEISQVLSGLLEVSYILTFFYGISLALLNNLEKIRQENYNRGFKVGQLCAKKNRLAAQLNIQRPNTNEYDATKKSLYEVEDKIERLQYNN